MSKIKTLEQVINQFKEKNGDKYDYSLITNYTVGKDKCQIICPKHGIFETTFDNHIQGKGCKKCQYEKLHNDNAMSKEEFINKSKEIYGDKYDYSKVNYYNSHSDVQIICPKHGIFLKKPYKHLQGQGCPKCKSYHLEQIIEDILKKEKIDYIWQCEVNSFKCDFYLPKYHLYIECQGEQHFVPTKFSPKTTDKEAELKYKKQQYRDEKLYESIKKNNEKIIYFTYEKYFKNKINIKKNEWYRDKQLFNNVSSIINYLENIIM